MGCCNFKNSKNFSEDSTGISVDSSSAGTVYKSNINQRLRVPTKAKIIKILNPKKLTLKVVREVPQEFEYSPIIELNLKL